MAQATSVAEDALAGLRVGLRVASGLAGARRIVGVLTEPSPSTALCPLRDQHTGTATSSPRSTDAGSGTRDAHRHGVRQLVDPTLLRTSVLWPPGRAMR